MEHDADDRARGDREGRRRRKRSPRSESPTNARRRWFGTARPVKPIYNAIVWQDRRTADACAELARAGHAELVSERAGLVLDPYFSATKIAWILDHVEGARARAARGELAFGTVDTFLLWRLTGGAVHATDATNASRTSLLNLRSGAWDDTLIELFNAPRSALPEVRDTAGAFGETLPEHFGAALPIYAMAGDQQSALVGQVCLEPGMAKATYGTGGFILLNTGATPIRSRHGLLTTIAYQWDGVRHYALEGSIFSAGATVQWLRDGLGIITHAAEAGTLAAQSDLGTGSLSGPRVRGPRRAALARRRARQRDGIDARRDAQGNRAGGVGERRLPNRRSHRRDDRRFCGERRGEAAVGRARRRRHGGERLDDAISRRHRRRAGRPADLQRDDGARRGVPRWLARRPLSGARRIRQILGPRSPLRADDERRDAPRCAAPAGAPPSRRRCTAASARLENRVSLRSCAAR